MAAGSPIKLRTRPRLKSPSLIAAWGCIGNVGLLSARYLVDKLRAKELGEIESESFFFPLEVVIRPTGSEALGLPQSRLYYSAEGPRNLLLCLTDEEPPLRRKEYADLLLDLAQEFGVRRVYTICAHTVALHHTAQPGVLGLVNDPRLIASLESCGVLPIDESTFRSAPSMNRLLLRSASARSVEGIYLLGEVPEYTTSMLNPRSSRAVLQVLSALLDLPLDLSGLDELTQQVDAEIDAALGEMAEKGRRDERLRQAHQVIEGLKGLEPDRSKYQIVTPAGAREEERFRKLLTLAEEDPTQIERLREELARLEPPQRLAILKKYGRRLLDVLGEGNVP